MDQARLMQECSCGNAGGTITAARRPEDDELDQVLQAMTPELVLVSPDIAASARALLPDRPWETWARRPPVRLETADRRPSLPLPRLATVEPDHQPARRGRERGWTRSLVGAHAVAGFAFVAFVVVGSALPPRDAPTLGPAPAPGTTRPREVGRRAGITNGGQIRLTRNESGRLMGRFDGTITCAGRVSIPRILVTSEGAFNVTREVRRGAQTVTVILDGRIDSRHVVHGSARAESPICDGAAVVLAVTPTGGQHPQP